MKKCPFHSSLRPSIVSLGGRLEKEILRVWEDVSVATKSYEDFGDLISEIFPPSFFESDIDTQEFFGMYPIDSKSLFEKRGEKQIKKYFETEKQRAIEFAPKKWTKLYPWSPEEAIIQWWSHACYIMVIFLNQILKKQYTDYEYDEFSKEAYKILTVLARQHLSVETGFALNIDSILSRGVDRTSTIYDDIDKINFVWLPALGCPALFFWDKRVGKMLFDWITRHMIMVYSTKSWSKIISEKILLSFRKIVNRIQETTI